MPIWAFAAAIFLSAPAMSGRRSSSADGKPIGMGGGSPEEASPESKMLKHSLPPAPRSHVQTAPRATPRFDRLRPHIFERIFGLYTRNAVVNPGS